MSAQPNPEVRLVIGRDDRGRKVLVTVTEQMPKLAGAGRFHSLWPQPGWNCTVRIDGRTPEAVIREIQGDLRTAAKTPGLAALNRVTLGLIEAMLAMQGIDGFQTCGHVYENDPALASDHADHAHAA